MKNLNLKEGYFVDDFDGSITKIHYVKIQQLYYGNVEDACLIFKDDILKDLTRKNMNTRIFNTLKEAQKESYSRKKERAKYYKEQIEYYKSELDKL